MSLSLCYVLLPSLWSSITACFISLCYLVYFFVFLLFNFFHIPSKILFLCSQLCAFCVYLSLEVLLNIYFITWNINVRKNKVCTFCYFRDIPLYLSQAAITSFMSFKVFLGTYNIIICFNYAAFVTTSFPTWVL